MINLIYIILIVFIIFRLRNKKEKFTEITNDKIEKCVNNTYLSHLGSIDNLNTIAKEINSQNNLLPQDEVPSHCHSGSFR